MKSSARTDLFFLIVWSFLAAVACVEFDLSEALVNWARPHEALQLDELPGVLLTVAAGLVWFAGRRYLEARTQLKLRLAADVHLDNALSENRRLARRALEAQESERKSLARDLHDELGQYINAIKLDAVAIRDSTQLSTIQSLSPGMIANIDRIYEVVRGLIRELRPVGLDLGIAAAIENCVDEWRTRLTADITLAIRGELQLIDEVRGIALYRLVQEGLTNVARHAEASEVHVDIAIDPNGEFVRAEVRDNGRGMPMQQVSQGLGLIGMRERIAALGGSVEAGNGPSGFCVRAVLPVRFP